ncbi:hypothetical protein ACVWZ4_002839 [Bradyrhizobium sp. USDA 4472]
MSGVSVALVLSIDFLSQLLFDLTALATSAGLAAGELTTKPPVAGWSETFFHELSTFVLAAAAIAVGIMAIALVTILLRASGYTGALDIITIVDRWIGPLWRSDARPLVNVEYRDADDTPMQLGSFVLATLRNSRGKFFDLVEGAFVHCEPAWIKAGALVHVSVQQGLVREDLYVLVDPERDLLYVRSQYRRAEMFEKINHGATTRGSKAGWG